MELPSCPSCGQSVLDDDAKDCPFCGAAMDGSSPSKRKTLQSAGKPEPKPKKNEKVEKAEKSGDPPADEDPFAIGQNPVAAKAIACADKPRKGRSQRVVCPMCDSQGFIPKAALGRQVKCANPKCMVPVFTAVTKEEKAAGRVPSRMSDEEVPVRKTKTGAGKPKNQILIYGVVGGVALLLTAGLAWYLNQEGPTQLAGVNIPMPDLGPEDDPAAKNPITTPKTVDHRKDALALVIAMIKTARSNDNDNKPLTRRMTGDAYLRLGMKEEADAEFAQMKVVAGGQDVTYYAVGPYVTQYWEKLKVGDAAGAAEFLSAANALSGNIPAATGQAMESAVVLSAALAHAGKIDEAKTLVARHQRDRTLESQQDSVDTAAWWVAADTMWNEQRISMPVFEVFAWHEPMMATIAVHLAAKGHWTAATNWAAAQDDTRTAGDAFALVAAEMVSHSAPETARQELAAAADKKGKMVSLRTSAVLARDKTTDAAWTVATAGFSALPEYRPVIFGSVPEMIDAERPDLTASLDAADAVAEYVVAAAVRGDAAQAELAVQRLMSIMMAVVPPSAEVRERALTFDRNSDQVEAMVAKELALTDGNRISSRFIAYRKSVDNFVRAAEDRRHHLLLLLARIIQNGGLDAVRNSLIPADGMLAKEVHVDSLSGLLFAAADERGLSFPEILNPQESLRVPIGRIDKNDQMSQHTIIPLIVAALQKQTQPTDLAILDQLDTIPQLPGLRSAVAMRIVERAATGASDVQGLLTSVLAIKNRVWRDQALEVATRMLVTNGKSDQLASAIEKVALAPEQRVSALYAIVRGKIAAIVVPKE